MQIAKQRSLSHGQSQRINVETTEPSEPGVQGAGGGGNCLPRHGQSLLLDSYVVKKFLRSDQHGGRTWDPNYTPGVDFLDHDFL